MEPKEKGKRLPMDSKTYPGEWFFFIRGNCPESLVLYRVSPLMLLYHIVNELVHGLGS